MSRCTRPKVHRTSSQYHAECYAEEMFHADQVMGRVGAEFGGFPGLFDVNVAMSKLDFSRVGEGKYSRRIRVGSQDEVHNIVLGLTAEISNELLTEYNNSVNVIDANRGYMELKAKEHARYNEAFKYECTYGNIHSGCLYCGPASELTKWNGRDD